MKLRKSLASILAAVCAVSCMAVSASAATSYPYVTTYTTAQNGYKTVTTMQNNGDGNYYKSSDIYNSSGKLVATVCSIGDTKQETSRATYSNGISRSYAQQTTSHTARMASYYYGKR